MVIESRASARAGLLGNPSDGYNGKTLSVIVTNFGAQITLWESPHLVLEPSEADISSYKNLYQLRESIGLVGYNGGIPLLKATIKRFVEYCEEQGIRLPNKNFTCNYRSSIPRQVGLSGSSAIIIAMLRALCRFYNVEVPKEYLPTLALSVETRELGITAGLQDRVAQVYEGVVYMDFEKGYMDQHQYGQYESIPPALLPKLYLAYNTTLSKVSGKVHSDIRTRWEKGEKSVVNAMNDIASLAKLGRDALMEERPADLFELINRNFDLRTQIMPITDRNMQLIQTARNLGASSSFCGSGGAIIGMYKDDAMLNRLFTDMKAIGARVIKPYIQ